MTEVQIKSESRKLTNFTQSLGKILRQIGIYTGIQIFAGIILAVATAGNLLSMSTATSLSEAFNIFVRSIWTILISSIIIEAIMYFFLIELIIILRDAANQGIPHHDNSRKSAISFLVGIILGIMFFYLDIYLVIFRVQIFHGLLTKHSFQPEDLQLISSTALISILVKVGYIIPTIVGFYYLKKNFEQIQGYTRNGKEIVKGFDLLIMGYFVTFLGELLGVAVSLASFIGYIGLFVVIIGYFRTSNALNEASWRI